ncbi:MAG: M20/M25/M40 family metallo-hydrolase [Acidobacteriota bacterium]
MTDAEILALHRQMVATPSVSGEEGPLCDLLQPRLEALGATVRRFGNNLAAWVGQGPLFCLNSHLDTVPASAAWTLPPHEARVTGDGRVVGLGSNDAKASVAAMVGAFARLVKGGAPRRVRILLLLSAQEEVGGKGTEAVVPEIERLGLKPEAVVVGEPTALDVAAAQKGLLILELEEEGTACHAAHGRALQARNAIRQLARDLAALEGVDLGPPHPVLGPVTMEPTVAQGGTARNVVPGKASCILDVRTVPGPHAERLVGRLRGAVAGGLRVVSDRLGPYETDPAHPLVRAALAARPASRVIGSSGLSDLVFFRGIPGIKAGPGRTERSHTPDEFVFESEILDGASFYERLVREVPSFLCAGGGA